MRWSRPDEDVVLRWAPRLFLLAAVVLVPWTVVLAVTLPAHSTTGHYRIAWVGFDCLLVVGMGHTAYLGFRRRPQAVVPAVATATLLVVDAWFDVTTSASFDDFALALALALLVEIPAALMILYLVHLVNQALIDRILNAPGDHDGR
jgi:hypothetical protein